MTKQLRPLYGWDLEAAIPIRELFEWCIAKGSVDRLLLSTRLRKREGTPTPIEPEVETIVSTTFGQKLLDRRVVRQWPGTELIGHDGLVYEIAFDGSLIDPMAQLGPTLEDWYANREPSLPEDPCLYRQGAPWPLLVSVTHERDAWLLSEDRPPFCVGEPFVFDPEELIVPPASQGFLAIG